MTKVKIWKSGVKGLLPDQKKPDERNRYEAYSNANGSNPNTFLFPGA